MGMAGEAWSKPWRLPDRMVSRRASISAAPAGRDESVKADKKARAGACVAVLEVMEEFELAAMIRPS